MSVRPLVAVLITALFATAASLSPIAASAQDPDAARRIAAQREAMAQLKSMDGSWRGPAWSLQPDGQKHEFIQTERIGSFLDGSVKVIEGRGHSADGRVTFNAMGIISYSPNSKTYSMRSYAMGLAGDFGFTPLPDGYTWTTPAGPNAMMRYKATITGDTLLEVGDRIVEGKEPVRVFEMRLKRVGNTDWPAGGAIGPG